MKTKPKAMKAWPEYHFDVPIFEVSVVVVVAQKTEAAIRKHFPHIVHADDHEACCCYQRSRFGLFFEPQALKRSDIVAHEIFHLTHRILEFRQANFDEGHHEVAAMLNGWLTSRVGTILDQCK